MRASKPLHEWQARGCAAGCGLLHSRWVAAALPHADLVWRRRYAADLGVLARRHCLLHEAAARLWVEHGL